MVQRVGIMAFRKLIISMKGQRPHIKKYVVFRSIRHAWRVSPIIFDFFFLDLSDFFLYFLKKVMHCSKWYNTSLSPTGGPCHAKVTLLMADFCDPTSSLYRCQRNDTASQKTTDGSLIMVQLLSANGKYILLRRERGRIGSLISQYVPFIMLLVSYRCQS